MCSRSSCYSCAKADGCGWCGPKSTTFGTCMSAEDADSQCTDLFTTERDQCPTVDADVMLKQIMGMLGAIVGVAVILNVCNRMSNIRRKRKLRRSIFTLPVYVYTASPPSLSRQRADARRQARAQASLDPSQDVGSPRSSTSSPPAPCSGSCTSSEDGDNASETTCSVCLTAYEEEDVIKVLPCGHEFHSGCLDSWLKLKAMCPLCKAPAFTRSRSQDRGRGGRDWATRGQAHIQGIISVASAPPLLRFGSSNRGRAPQLDSVSGRAGGASVAGLSLESAATPETTAGVAEIGSRVPQPGGGGETGGGAYPGLSLESAPPPTSSSVAEVAGVDDSPRAVEEPPGGATVSGRNGEVGAPSPSPEVVLVVEGAGLEGARSREEAVTASGGGSGRTLTGEPASAPAESVIVSKNDRVASAVCATGAGGAADGGGGEEMTHLPGPSPPCHGGSMTGDDRQVSMSELEGGQAGQAKASIVADFTEGGGLDVVAAGGTALGLDIENGGSVVDGSMSGFSSVSPARLITVATSRDG